MHGHLQSMQIDTFGITKGFKWEFSFEPSMTCLGLVAGGDGQKAVPLGKALCYQSKIVTDKVIIYENKGCGMKL